MEPYDACLCAVSIFFNGISWSFGLVNKVRIEDVEFISLHDFWGRVIMVIMSLVVFIPFITSVDAIKIFRFSWSVFVMPPINLQPHLRIN